MKITKSFLKQVIKEELEHLKEYEDIADEVFTINLRDPIATSKVEYRGAPVVAKSPEHAQALENFKKAADKLAFYTRPQGMERY